MISLILQSHGLFQSKSVFEKYINDIVSEKENGSNTHINTDVEVNADKKDYYFKYMYIK